MISVKNFRCFTIFNTLFYKQGVKTDGGFTISFFCESVDYFFGFAVFVEMIAYNISCLILYVYIFLQQILLLIKPNVFYKKNSCLRNKTPLEKLTMTPHLNLYKSMHVSTENSISFFIIYHHICKIGNGLVVFYYFIFQNKNHQRWPACSTVR